MRRAITALLIWGSVAAGVGGFVLPWAHIDVREPSAMKVLRQTADGQRALSALTQQLGRVTVEVRRGTKTITGDLPTLSDIPTQVRGIEIPQMANQQNTQVLMALVELFTNTRQHLGAKSYAVYAVPGLLLLCGVLLTVWRERRAMALIIAALCAAIAIVGFWKCLTTNTRTLFIAITIGRGVWLSLWAYVTLALTALLQLFPSQRTLH